MAYGIVIKMDDGHYNTPNRGVLMDLQTGIKYNFAREGQGDSYNMQNEWNVKVHDIVTFTIDGASSAKSVVLYKKHIDGVVYS